MVYVGLFVWCFAAFVYLKQETYNFANKNYYDILEVPNIATNEEIRKAYKNLARKLHPDRAGDSNEAQNNYMKLNKAYEVLMNQKLREKYDRDGKLELEDNDENEQSSSMFGGLYSKDRDYIVALRSGNFEHSVIYSGDIWMVNFYSSHCQHCIDFAETFRTIGMKYKNVIHIGEFNCLNDYYVCSKENIRTYPTIKMYPSENQYSGDFSIESFDEFIIRNTGSFLTRLTKNNLAGSYNNDQDSVFILSKYDLDKDDMLRANLLGIAMKSINVRSYLSDCEVLNLPTCKYIKDNSELSVLYIPMFQLHNDSNHQLYNTLDTQSLIKYISREKVALKMMDDIWVQEFESNLKTGHVQQLILFCNEKLFKQNYITFMQLKQTISKDIPLVFLDCESTHFCKKVYLKDVPILIYVNKNGMQVHHGNLIAGEIVSFYNAAKISNVVSLHPLHAMWEAAVTRTLDHSLVYLYNSHCQPCIKKIWEFRKLWALLPDNKLSLYSIDCSVFSDSCVHIGVSYGYPYLKFFNGTVQEISNDFTNAQDIIEFINDTNVIYVETITPKDIMNKVYDRKKNEIWLLDFYHPQCMPCLELVPVLKKLAKKYKNIRIAKVDCGEYSNECLQHEIEYYPTLRLFPADYKNSKEYIKYNSWIDYNLLDQFLLDYLPSSVHKVTTNNYRELVERDSSANWVLDLYASWCGPCRNFMPTFVKIAEQMTKQTLKFGKVDCAVDFTICRTLGAQFYPYLVIMSPYDKSDVQQIDSSVWDIRHISSQIERLMKEVDADL